MSETRKAVEMQAGIRDKAVKAMKWLGWFCIIFGAIKSTTIFGAIVIGIPFILLGVCTIFFSKFVGKQVEAMKGATSEQAEIIEHQLQQARAEKAKQNSAVQ
jgi:Sec-independent protein secretion pathway component TatC